MIVEVCCKDVPAAPQLRLWLVLKRKGRGGFGSSVTSAAAATAAGKMVMVVLVAGRRARRRRERRGDVQRLPGNDSGLLVMAMVVIVVWHLAGRLETGTYSSEAFPEKNHKKNECS